MKRIILLLNICIIAHSLPAVTMYYGFGSGFQGGPGAGINFLASDLASGLPLDLEAGGSWFRQADSGNANEARKIFINDNAGGEIEKHGEITSLYFNLRFAVSRNGSSRWYFFIGPRYTSYGAYFGFIGDNEAFTVSSDIWGIGGGVALEIPVGSRTRLLLKGGIEAYFKGRFDGHGQYSYDPDGVDDNPRNAYTYEDADKAVNQPRLLPGFMLMLHFRM